MLTLLLTLAGIGILVFLMSRCYGPADYSDVVDRDVERARAEIAAIASRADHR